MTKKWDEDEEDDGNDNDVDARPQLGEVLDTFAAHDMIYGMPFLSLLTTVSILSLDINLN